MGRRRTACQTCAAIKASCSQGRPCKRCQRLSLPCSYKGDDYLPATDITRRPPKTGYTRSNGGCSNCRLRRKKCDEQVPTCGDCQRLHLECSISTAKQGLGASPPDCQQASPPEWASSFAQVFEQQTFSRQFASWVTLVEDEYRTHGGDSTTLAHSAALEDLPIPCARDDDAAVATFLPSTALNNLTGVLPSALKDWSFGERHLLNHFVQSVARLLTVVGDEDNPFLRFVTPMVVEHSMIRHGVLALSACHLSKVYPVFSQDLLLHRSLALQQLRINLLHHDSLEYALVTTLFLCLTEICEGESRTWMSHLHGANALFALIDPFKLSEEPYPAMLDLYNYLCCMASATASNVPPRVESTSSSNSTDLPLFGLASSLHKTLPYMHDLADGFRNGIASLETLQEQAKAIELTLQSWAPVETGPTDRHEGEARAAAFAMQWALMLLLKQITGTLRNDDPAIAKAASHILSALSLIRPGSEVEAVMLFPVFMAGVASMTKTTRLTVDYRLEVMETTVGFGNIFVAHRLLDELWRLSNDGEVVDWQALMKERYPGLVLL